MLKTAVLVLPLFLVACGGPTVMSVAAKATPEPARPGKVPLPSAHSPADNTTVTGMVVESMDAGAYTYVRLMGPDGEIWAAVNETALKPGSKITIDNAMWMENFESKTLKRKFDHILFGSIVTGGETAAALPPGHPPAAAAAGTQTLPAEGLGDVKVEKASGKDARTVAEIWEQRASLKGAEVVVRGKVVKFNSEIMGRNWLHLRDGSGSPEKRDNDITVTTSEVMAKGDVVTIRGKVVLDQDFTAGYAYPVMIEGAKVIR